MRIVTSSVIEFTPEQYGPRRVTRNRSGTSLPAGGDRSYYRCVSKHLDENRVMNDHSSGMNAQGGYPIAVTAVKTVHTIVFLGELAAIGWLVVTGFTGRRDRTVGLAAAAVALEAGVFCANDGVCPLTPLTERLGAARGGVSDIFLPDAVARTTPIWSSLLLALAAVLHARSAIRAARGSAARA